MCFRSIALRIASHERDRRRRSQEGCVFVHIRWVGTSRGLFIVTNIYGIIYYVLFPCWFAPSLPVGRVAKSHVKFDPSHGVLACRFFFVVGIILGPHTISAIVAFFQLVAARGAIHIRIAPTWTFMRVAVAVLVVAIFVVAVVSASFMVQRRLYLGGQFLDYGGEFCVGACDLADGFGQ